jgi:circadian clock protein KaiB
MTSPPDNASAELIPEPEYVLRLYTSGQTVTSARAIVNIRRFCEEHLVGKYHLEIVDVVQHPEVAATDQIIALPTLVRQKPLPLRRFIGDLSHTERLLARMED